MTIETDPLSENQTILYSMISNRFLTKLILKNVGF